MDPSFHELGIVEQKNTNEAPPTINNDSGSCGTEANSTDNNNQVQSFIDQNTTSSTASSDNKDDSVASDPQDKTLQSSTANQDAPLASCSGSNNETEPISPAGNDQLGLLVDSKENKYKCKCCEKSFPAIYDLFQHKIKYNHTGEKPYECQEAYKCEKCDIGFVRIDQLRKHNRSHNIKGPPFHCDECNISFRTENRYNIHIVNHITGQLEEE